LFTLSQPSSLFLDPIHPFSTLPVHDLSYPSSFWKLTYPMQRLKFLLPSTFLPATPPSLLIFLHVWYVLFGLVHSSPGGHSLAYTTMFEWFAAFLAREPAKCPPPVDSPPSPPTRTHSESILEKKNWPNGSDLRKEIRFREPDGWAHSNWSW
jgi:hypothetical protein